VIKPFQQVEQAHVLSHSDPLRDSVHRSSLLIPELPGARVEISFVKRKAGESLTKPGQGRNS
jgi:hypothetical protein